METKHLKFFALLLILVQCLNASKFVTEVTETMFIALPWANITNIFTSGSTKDFLSYKEVQKYLNELEKNFPELVLEVETIGKTVEQRDIKALRLGLKKKDSSQDNQSEQKPRILFTGFLRGSDFMSTAMIMHLTNHLIYESLHNNPNIKYLLQNREIWIIPVVNADAYQFLSDYFDEYNRTTVVTKNRRQNDPKNICETFGIGIDLNRNFDVFFDKLDILPRTKGDYTQSENYICKPYYRGPKPFSEPETAAIRDFLNKRQFEAAINFVERGNMFLTPNNYDASLENSALKEKTVYQSIKEECPFPSGIQFGTRYQILEETIHGEISDYMLNKKQIIAGSYALGVSESGYEEYLPTPAKARRILKENLDAAMYFIYKAGVNFRIEELFQGRCDSNIPECPESETSSYIFRLKVSNTGLRDSTQKTLLQISFKSNNVYDLQQVSIKPESGTSTLAGLGIDLQGDSKITYQIELPPLGKGESVEVAPVFVRSSPDDSEPLSDISQILIVKIKDYPTNKLSHYEGLILEPNFDIEEAKEQSSRRNMLITIGLIIVSCWATFGGCGYALIKHFKGKPQNKFKKLGDESRRDAESPSTVVDHDDDTGFKHREAAEQEPEERVTRKDKKRGAKSGSKSKSGSRSKDEKKKKKASESPKSKPKKASK